MKDSGSTGLWLRWAALAEATSYICLLAAVIAKHAFNQPGGVTVIGPIHGLVFLAYVALVLSEREKLNWPLSRTAFAIAAAVVPLGGVFVERRFLPADA